MSMDAVQRFLFEDLDIRGAVVQLTESWQKIQGKHAYAKPVMTLLGEMSAVTAIIAANLKTPGRITFQLSGHGAVNMLVLDCNESLNLRGHAKTEGPIVGGSLAELFGDGRLLLSLDTAGMRQPYQSYVPLEGDSIAKVFEHFLEQSEQTPAALFLAADKDAAAGLFLQKLPGADLKNHDGWNRLQQLAGTVTPGELLSLEAPQLLMRLFHEETLRLFKPRPVRHDFPPNWERIRATLRSLGRDELESLIAEQGEVVVRDDLSNHEYRFDAEAIRALFDGPHQMLH
ncbi:MAG: Hsp33 family molecular chaperone HslO [Betaproteobacteria bacterium]|nr:Hsp33 family molecular chaperone HslO [Betaproteobacteria bacterium]